MRVYLEANLDYVSGYLKYGHKEGVIEIPDEDIEEFNQNMLRYIKEKGLDRELEVVVDDYRIEDYGDLYEISEVQFLD